jgi:hypothetical protein
MKTRPLTLLFAFAGLLSASQPVLAAAPKTDARATALVAALQAVSPDPLAGRLGLAASVAGQAAPAKQGGRNQTAQSTSAQIDQRAYASWKVATKS